MKPEQQRIAIAEACGWELVPSHDGYHGGIAEAFPDFWLDPEGEKHWQDMPLPNYLNDLNAMHEAVKTLPQNIKPRYFACLCVVVSGAISLHGYSEATEATAAQRCEAFLRTLNLWQS